MRRTLVTVRGDRIEIDRDPETPFLDVVRKDLGRKSVVRGCANESCGACRVIVNGELHASCMLLWRAVPDDAIVETYEDVAEEQAVQSAVAAFDDDRPTRCKLCVGALGLAAHHLEAKHAANEAGIEGALVDATCMCTGRTSLRRALTRALVK